MFGGTLCMMARQRRRQERPSARRPPPAGKRPDLAASWGEMENVSSAAKLTEASERLRHALDTQRIAWIEADPLTALHAEIKDGCGYARLAR
jgi:hypothetical protein